MLWKLMTVQMKEEGWWSTRVLLPKALICKKMSSQKPTVTTVCTSRRKNLCEMWGEIKKLPFIKGNVYLTFSFRKNLNKGKYSIYRNLLHVSLLTHSPLSRTCRSKSFLPLVASSVLMVKDNFVRLYLCKVKRSLKPYQNEKKATKNM